MLGTHNRKERLLAHAWKHGRAASRIESALAAVQTVTIADYTRDLSLENIPVNKAYRTHAAHLYVDIVNLDDLLNITVDEGVTCHRRALRFLDLHYRAARRIFRDTDAKRIDFHNQRLHAFVAKPYGDHAECEAARVHHAVANAQLMIDVLAETGEDDEQIPDAIVRVGIDSGEALAVNNGRRGGREPLFLGAPANHAAKLSGAGKRSGIYLTNIARSAIGLSEVETPETTPLTVSEVSASQEIAQLGVDKDDIVTAWREDLEANPIGTFEFTRHTPPLRTMDIASLTPANSRRQELISLYADLDGFTAYVDRNIDNNAEDVVRVLHVLRSELDHVLSADFEGRRVRFIGDCLHGLMCEGTAHATDEGASVSDATLCSGALHSSVQLALEKLGDQGIDTEGLGLQVGFELGPVTTTRLGAHGDRVRCSLGRSVRKSESEQGRCAGGETALGSLAYGAASEAVRTLFGSRRRANFDYNEAVESLSDEGDETARAAKSANFIGASPAIIKSATVAIKPHAEE